MVNAIIMVETIRENGDIMTSTKERLQKVIAQSGVTSRRKAEKLIVDGKVKVNKVVSGTRYQSVPAG